MTVEQRIEHFSYRLRAMFPYWPVEMADFAAQRLVENADQMVFQMEAEKGLAEIPTLEAT